MAHSANVISKIKLPRSDIAYELHDIEALHASASDFDSAGAASAALTEAKGYTDTKISALGAVLNFKGTKTSAQAIFDLTDAKKGDVWLVASSDADNGKEYVYISDTVGQTGAANWEMFGVSTDLTSVVTKGNYNAHKHSVEIAGSNSASNVTASGNIAAGTVLTGKTQKHLTISRGTDVAIAAGETDEALGVGATFNTTVNASTTTLSASASDVAVGVSTYDEVLGAGTTFSVSGGALTGATQANFDTTKFHGGSASVPTVINTAKFTGGSITDGAVTGGVYRNATAASWTGSVDANGTLTIGWTPNNIGEVTPISYTKQVLTPAAFQQGFYTAGKASVPASIDDGIFTKNSVGTVSTITVKANTNDKVNAATGVAVTAQPSITIVSGAEGDVNVATGISSATTTVATQDKVTAMTSLGAITQPVFNLADTATSGGITFVSDNASAKVDINVTGTAEAQSWTQTGATVGTPDKQQA